MQRTGRTSPGDGPIPAGPHASTRERPFGLTRREHEVLDLICAEHTNTEIAAKLFLSVKTVDHHVPAVLAKLGVPTRAAAMRAICSAERARKNSVHPAITR